MSKQSLRDDDDGAGGLIGGGGRHRTWQYLIDWTVDMARRYGGTVWDRSGKQWDWGQAICREMYGADWMKDAEFRTLNDTPDTEPVPDDVLKRARDWQFGEWPSWVDVERTSLRFKADGISGGG